MSTRFSPIPVRPCASTQAPAAVLSPENLWHFDECGCAVLPDVCPPGELTDIRRVLVRFFAHWTGGREDKQHMLDLYADAGAAARADSVRPSVFAPELLRTEYFRRLSRAARQLLGPDARLSFDQTVMRPAHTPDGVRSGDGPQHEPGRGGLRRVFFWMPLQDTAVEMGWLCCARGEGVAPAGSDAHRHADSPSGGGCGDLVGRSPSERLQIPAGACIAYDGGTLRSMLRERSAADQFAYVVVFAAPLANT